MSQTKCLNYSCEKSKECKRCKNEFGIEIDFKNVCNEKNDFKWLWKIDQEIQVVDNTENINNTSEEYTCKSENKEK